MMVKFRGTLSVSTVHFRYFGLQQIHKPIIVSYNIRVSEPISRCHAGTASLKLDAENPKVARDNQAMLRVCKKLDFAMRYDSFAEIVDAKIKITQ